MNLRWVVPSTALVLGSLAACAAAPPEGLKLPPGFRIELFAKVPDARSMAMGAKGTLFVGSRKSTVHAVKNGRVIELLEGLNVPNGVAFRDGALYVAEIGRILRYDGIEDRLDDPPAPVVVREDYPKDGHHGWKFIAFGPDGWLYVPVGAPCNVCLRPDPYATITRIKPDGSAREVYARGVRNTVGFAWHPETKELWFTDNGRDWMGDDLPPCELNVAPKAGLHFGFPHCHGRTVADPEFGEGKACSEFVPPVVEFGAHTAPLGMRFYTGGMFPAEWKGRILVAQHGSWNRSAPVGYRVLAVDPKTREVVPFVDGFLQGRRVSGRPVDVEQLADGSVLISDDGADAIWRVTYEGAKK